MAKSKGKFYIDMGQHAPPVTGDVISLDYETTGIDWAKEGWSSSAWVHQSSKPDPALTAAVIHKMMREIAAAYSVPLRYLHDTAREEDEPMPRFTKPPKTTQCITSAENHLVPPGKVAFTRGSGTFNARLRLKALGGRWEKDLLGGVWLLPEGAMHQAAANIRLAEKVQRELPLDESDDPEVERIEKIRCYVCGTNYLPWEFAKLAGSNANEWFCGCETRKKGAAPRVAQVRR